MPVDQLDMMDYAHSSAAGTQHEYVDDCGRLMRGTEEVDCMEPSPRPMNVGDEVKGFVMEQWGRLTHDELLVKEGMAIEKGTHAARDRARMTQNLDRFLETYGLPSARTAPTRRHTQ